jgi:hypothetical protein
MRVDVPEYNTFIDFPDNTPPEEIQMAMQQNFPSKVQPQAEKGFLTRAGERLSERGANLYDITRTGTLPEKVGRVVGNEIGALTDVLGEGLTSLVKTVTPDIVTEKSKQGIQSLFSLLSPSVQQYTKENVQSFGEGVQSLEKGWGEFRKNNPNLAYDLEALANIGSVVPIGKTAQAIKEGVLAPTGKAISTVAKGGVALAKETGRIADTAISKTGQTVLEGILPTPTKEIINTKIKETVNDTFTKAIRPLDREMGKTTKAVDKFNTNAATAVEDIIVKKDSFEPGTFLNKKGMPIDKPDSVASFRDAIDIRKPQIYESAIQDIKAAKGQGASIDVQPWIDEYKGMLENTKLSSKIDPAANLQIKRQIKQWEQLPDRKLDLEQAQKDLAKFNADLAPTWNSLGYKSRGQREIDARSATLLRRGLDDTITEFVGSGFQEKKDLLGAYKTIEDAVARRANQITRSQNNTSIVRASDIWIGYHTGLSLYTGNVAGVAAAGTAEFIKKRIESLVSPDHQIKKMFEKVDGLVSKRSNLGPNIKPNPDILSLLQKSGAARVKEPKSGKYWNENMSNQISGLTPSETAKEYGKGNRIYERLKRQNENL